MYLSIHQLAPMTVEEVLGLISDWSVVIPFLTGLLLFKKLSIDFKLITIITALSTVPQLMNAFKLDNDALKNFTYNLYTPFEFLLLYFIFIRHVNERKERQVLKTSVVLYILLSVLFIYNSGFVARFLNEWACINNLIYTAWILIIFYNQYSLSNNSKLNLQTPVFWIFTGLLFYTPCSSIVFSIWTFKDQPGFVALKSIHHVVNIGMYVCFTIGIYKDALLNSSFKTNNMIS